MTFIQLPPELMREYQEVGAKGYRLWQSRQFLAAVKVFRDLYESLKAKQPINGRYHKGGPLFDEAISWIHAAFPEKGAQPLLLAYIEDCLSDGLGNPLQDNHPAAQTLRDFYGMATAAFENLAKVIRARGNPASVRDPESVYEEHLRSLGRREEEVLLALEQLRNRKRNYQRFDKDWERRVFIGGSYRDPSKLEFLRKIVMDLEFEPIIASDFVTPSELTRHHSLMLLHNCRFAVFDLTIEGGQLPEIERSPDYEVEAIALYPASDPEEEAKLSAMIKSHPIEKAAYRTLEEMRDKVVAFLERPR